MRTVQRSVFATLAACFIVACGSKPTTKPAPLYIASIFDLTGAGQDALSPHLENALTLAVDQINQAGGVRGRDIELIKMDSEGKVDVANARLTEAYGKTPFLASFTGITSTSTGVANGFSKTNGVINWCVACTAPGLTAANGGGWLYRTALPADKQAVFLAKYAWDNGWRKVSLAYVDQAFAWGLVNPFKVEFEKLGGQVVNDIKLANDATLSFTADLAKMTTNGSQATLLFHYVALSTKVLRDYGETGYTFPFFFAHTGRIAEIYDALPSSTRAKLEGMGGTSNVAVDGAEGQAFAQAYKARFASDPPIFASATYDGMMLLALAAEASGKDDPTSADVKEGLKKLSDPSAESFAASSFAKAREAVRAGKTINFVGASGPCDLDANGSVNGRFQLWKLVNGKITDLSQTDVL